MNGRMEIAVDWIGTEHDGCAARLAIRIAGLNAFRAENRWSNSIDEAPPLSALPLAQWLAANWWRLRWEPAPAQASRQTDWKMAHEVAAAGGGFLWPRVAFIADGETIEAHCEPSPPNSREVLRYLSGFRRTIPAADFEAAVDGFVALVIERLAIHGEERDLAALWAEVLRERADPLVARHRRLEALLGIDPGEVAADVAASFGAMQQMVGEQTTDELAAACAGPHPKAELEALRAHADASRLCGEIATIAVLDAVAFPPDILPPERGRTLARQLRAAIHLDPGGPVTDRVLGDLLGLSERQLTFDDAPGVKVAAGVAMTGANRRRMRYAFRQQRRATSRRFEGARFLGDALAYPDDSWHPASPAETARQKQQRAFAAEFLAPVEAITDYLRDDFSSDAIDGAAEYFDVSAYMIGSQLRNNRVIAHDHPAVPP